MERKTDKYLLEKYRIPQMGDYSKPGSVLCGILRRLETNKKMNEPDKKWIRDKGMINFCKFIEKWEKTGKPNFNIIRSPLKKNTKTPAKNRAKSKNIPKKTGQDEAFIDMGKPGGRYCFQYEEARIKKK